MRTRCERQRARARDIGRARARETESDIGRRRKRKRSNVTSFAREVYTHRIGGILSENLHKTQLPKTTQFALPRFEQVFFFESWEFLKCHVNMYFIDIHVLIDR